MLGKLSRKAIADLFSKKSNAAVSEFRRFRDSLVELNNAAFITRNDNESAIQEIEQINNEISAQMDSNYKIIKNANAFLGE